MNAQLNLGVMYGNGRGVSQDFTEAVSWYRKAADWSYIPAGQALEELLKALEPDAEHTTDE